MANSILLSTALRLTYDFGMIGDKKSVKTRTVNSIRTDATDDQLLAFVAALAQVQSHPAAAKRVDTTGIEA